MWQMAGLTLIGFGEVIATFSCIQWRPDLPPRAARLNPQSPMGLCVGVLGSSASANLDRRRARPSLDCTWLRRLMSLAVLLYLRCHVVLNSIVGALSLRLLPHVFKFWWFGIAKMTARRLVTATFLLTCLQAVLSFQHVPNSPCTDVCSGNPQNTLEKDVVCFDTDYTDNKDGEALRNCVACELNSTAVDTANNQSDVEWALCTRNKHPAIMDLY